MTSRLDLSSKGTAGSAKPGSGEDEPRCLVYNDFCPRNVALPRSETGQAVIFDWEFSGIGLPQYDLQNFWTGRQFEHDWVLSTYIDCLQERGRRVDVDRFKSILTFSELSRVLYALWMLHLKLETDPSGTLPSWMVSLGEDLAAGGLARLAEEAR
jgi:thiamine kinase-like enzyme